MGQVQFPFYQLHNESGTAWFKRERERDYAGECVGFWSGKISGAKRCPKKKIYSIFFTFGCRIFDLTGHMLHRTIWESFDKIGGWMNRVLIKPVGGESKNICFAVSCHTHTHTHTLRPSLACRAQTRYLKIDKMDFCVICDPSILWLLL